MSASEFHDLDNAIVALFEDKPGTLVMSSFDISQALPGAAHAPIMVVITRCMALVTQGRLTSREDSSGVLYSRGQFTHYRHTTPVFYGTPEHLVCHRDGRTLAWCSEETVARLIVNSLNKD